MSSAEISSSADAAHQAVKEVLAVAFKDNLNLPIFHDINENIRQLRLRLRMKVRLGLFDNED